MGLEGKEIPNGDRPEEYFSSKAVWTPAGGQIPPAQTAPPLSRDREGFWRNYPKADGVPGLRIPLVRDGFVPDR